MIRSKHLLVGALIAGVACADASGSVDMERTVVGDTLIIHIRGGSVWDSSATLVEELRIGKLEGRPEEMFGSITDMTPDGHGGVFIFDGQVPALRHFDSTGGVVATLGRKGAGPGEYQDAVIGMSVRPDGRLFVRDMRNARINVYGVDGKPETQMPVSSNLFTSRAMVVDTAGEIYIKILAGPIEKNRPWPIGLLHLASDGTVIDTVRPPALPGEPETEGGTFGIGKVWEVSSTGDLVAGVNSSYRFELRKSDGKVIRVEKDYTPVQVGAEEHAELEARNEWTRQHQGRFMTAEIPPVSNTKPAYRAFDIGTDGQIWIRLYTAAVKTPVDEDEVSANPERPPVPTWREPAVYDVFQPDGTYLGQVRFPAGVSLLSHNGNEVWGRQSGESGELQVIRYRLVAGGAN